VHFNKNRVFIPLVNVSQIKPHYFYAECGTIQWIAGGQNWEDVLRGLLSEKGPQQGMPYVEFLADKRPRLVDAGTDIPPSRLARFPPVEEDSLIRK